MVCVQFVQCLTDCCRVMVVSDDVDAGSNTLLLSKKRMMVLCSVVCKLCISNWEWRVMNTISGILT